MTCFRECRDVCLGDELTDLKSAGRFARLICPAHQGTDWKCLHYGALESKIQSYTLFCAENIPVSVVNLSSVPRKHLIGD